jgi:hypothetical protein
LNSDRKEKRKKPKQLPSALRALLTALGVLALSAVLTFALHNASVYRTGSWDDYSEALVFGRMLQMQQDQSAPGGFMGVYTADWGDAQNRYLYEANTPVSPDQYQSYVHQSGLQGWAFGIANKVFSLFSDDGAVRLNALYFLNSMLFYAATLCVCLAVCKSFGLLAAIGWLAAVCFAPGLQTGMKNLYWCLWLWLLPLLAGILLCAATARHGKTPWWCFVLVGISCLVRCLCGFEYISTFLILMELPLAVCWLKKPAARHVWFGRMAAAGGCGLAGVGAALGFWLCQGRIYYGSWAQSLQNVGQAAGSRMSITDAAVRQGTTVSGVLVQYLWQDATVLLRFGPLELSIRTLWIGMAALLGSSALVWTLLRRRDLLAGIGPAAAVWALGFAAPVSWMVLSKAHAAVHTWLTPMLWYFVFVPASGMLAGLLIRQWFRMAKPDKKA